MFDDDDLAALRSLGPPDATWERPPAHVWDRIAAAVADDGAPDAMTAGSEVTPLRRRSRPRRAWWAAAAAAMVAVVIGAAALRTIDDGDSEDVLARAPLEVLAGDGTGSAELIGGGDRFRLRVATEGLAEIDGYYEVWLLDEGVTGLISLGPLRTDGVYDLPSGIDPADFPIVDVSIEPFDGDPAHSSNSVLRAELAVPR